MDYALIEDGIVTNIIWLHPHNESEFHNAVSLNDRSVGIGDTYDGSDFYRNGEKVLTPIKKLELELNEYKSYYEAVNASIE